MKKFLLSLTLLAASLAGYAQTLGEAFYVYRNDGGFEAFFRQEVDSITFEYEDEQGRTYDEIVMQRVYTKDSVYQIPLANIDSVAFLTPQTIVNEKVFPLTAEHAPYITDGSTTGFLLSSTAPQALRPQVGNIVVATADCDAFPEGIVATVTATDATTGGTRYSCELATMDDVFDQIVLCERMTTDNAYTGDDTPTDSIAPRDSMAMARRQIFDLDEDEQFNLWDFGWESEFGEEDKAQLTFGGHDKATLRVIVSKSLFRPLYVKMELHNTFTATMKFHAEQEGKKEWEKQIGKTVSCGKIPLPYTFGLLWLQPMFSIYGYGAVSGKVSVDFTARNTRTDTLAFVYTKGDWDFPHKPKDDPGIDVSRLSLEGSVEVGVKPVIDFALNGRGMSFGLTGKIGIRETANFLFEAEGALDGSLYETIKDSYVRTTAPWSLQAQASLNLFDKYKVENNGEKRTKPIAPEEPPQIGHDIYFLPLFSNVYARGVSGNNSNAWCMARATRPCLFPLRLGFQLSDASNTPVPVVYQETPYTGDNQLFSVTVDGLGDGAYTARPAINIMGYDLVVPLSAPLIKVATVEATESDGTVTLRGRAYGGTPTSAGFYYGPHLEVDNKPSPANFIGATIASNGEFTATLTDLEPGKLYVAATATIANHLGQPEESRGDPLELTVTAPAADEPTAGDIIDLGLSVRWASKNVGASSPEEIGGYCGWAMTNVSMTYDSNDYIYSDKFANGGTGKLGQLKPGRNDIGFDICGNLQYDAAAAAGMGRLPTGEEITELCDNCTAKAITYKGSSGLLLTGPNGNSIFLPFSSGNSSGSYWGGTAYISNYRNYFSGLSVSASGSILGSGPQVTTGGTNWAEARMVRGVVK